MMSDVVAVAALSSRMMIMCADARMLIMCDDDRRSLMTIDIVAGLRLDLMHRG